MGFHRYQIPILQKDYSVKYILGWADENEEFGYYPLKRKTKNDTWTSWKYVATDLASGTRVICLETRKACVEWIKSNIKNIEIARNMPTYKKCVEQIRLVKTD